MNEREALLRAVCENPDDDTPRLVFADWLAENGEEERGELIRIQVRMAQLKQEAIASKTDWRVGEWKQLSEREMELLRTNDEEWWAELPRTKGYFLQRLFSRGFVTSIWVSGWKDFIKDAPAIFASTPVVEAHFRGRVDFPALARIGYLARLRRLDIARATLRRQDVLKLAEPNSLPALERMVLVALQNQALCEQLTARFGERLCYVTPG